VAAPFIDYDGLRGATLSRWRLLDIYVAQRTWHSGFGSQRRWFSWT
jgi:hypothetical protein